MNSNSVFATASKIIFHFIGFFSALSFLGLAYFLIWDVWDGRFDGVRLFFRENRGIEPFIIFVIPVIIIAGPVWIGYAVTKRWRILVRSKSDAVTRKRES